MKEGPFSNFKYFPFFDTKLSSYRNIINFLLIIIFFISVSFLNVSAQVGKSFFTVHCDPPHSPNWSYLVEIVDSANAYNIPLTIMLTPPWADSVYSNSSKANQLALWQLQGHEIGAHHHGLSAANPLTWDGYTNASNIEIAQAGLDSLDKIGDMDDFLAYMRPIAGSETLTTGGIAEEYDWPSGLIYRAEGLNYDHTDVFSTISVYNHNGFQVCGLTYANVNNTSVNYAMAQFNNYGNNYCTGLITHANNFSNNMLSSLNNLPISTFKKASIKKNQNDSQQ